MLTGNITDFARSVRIFSGQAKALSGNQGVLRDGCPCDRACGENGRRGAMAFKSMPCGKCLLIGTSYRLHEKRILDTWVRPSLVSPPMAARPAGSGPGRGEKEKQDEEIRSRKHSYRMRRRSRRGVRRPARRGGRSVGGRGRDGDHPGEETWRFLGANLHLDIQTLDTWRIRAEIPRLHAGLREADLRARRELAEGRDRDPRRHLRRVRRDLLSQAQGRHVQRDHRIHPVPCGSPSDRTFTVKITNVEHDGSDSYLNTAQGCSGGSSGSTFGE